MTVEQSRPRIVIAGAGSAGLLSAIHLARAGCTVELFDKRPFPAGTDEDWGQRTWFSTLSARGLRAVLEAGIPASSLQTLDTGILKFSGIIQLNGSMAAAQLAPHACLGGEEQAFVRAFAHMAAEQHPELITVHWGTAVSRVDLAGKRLWVVRPGGCEEMLSYDLLLGADSWDSKVRSAAEEQVPGFRASVGVAPRRHKTFTVGAHACMPMRDASGGNLLWSLTAASSQHNGSLFIAPDPRSSGGQRVKGLLAMNPAAWEGLESAADYGLLLLKEYPSLPPEFIADVARQLVGSPLRLTGHRVICSSLHGPSMILIGNAAHAISPLVGNGLSAAVEDTWILKQVLQQCGRDLDAIPERWSAARLADAQALVRLDEAAVRRRGRGPLGRLDPLFLSSAAAGRARHLLRRWSGGRLVSRATPQGGAVASGGLRYSQVEEQLRRDDALMGIAACLAAVAVAAAVKLGRSSA